MIFADPPDNLGLGYNDYKDKLPPHVYYSWFRDWLLEAMRVSPCVWISYYWSHDIEIKHHVRNILLHRYPTFSAKTFIWRFTFGQHNQKDCGSGFRYILRLLRAGTPLYADEIRVISERQRLGDARANPSGRVPDDVWDFPPEILDIPRVVGNAVERRSWHPTQHPERLVDRIINLSTKPGDKILDLFAGTGTVLRVGKSLGRQVDCCEIDPTYCEYIAKENNESITTDPTRVDG